MGDSKHELIKALFIRAMELPSGDRRVFVERHAAEDPEVRDRVIALITSHPDSDREHATRAASDRTTLVPVPLSEGPGTVIGHYRLLESLGEGGFGVVFRAEQRHPVRRLVAIKIIKLGMDTRAVIARFEAERQALAIMDHPSIAKVFDAGVTDSGRPYFVMELVRGQPITVFCDQRRLSMQQRLDLFQQVCHAVHHAHQKGVIHRDLKPSNVLVTVLDGDKPLPKIIDFGIAKATTGPLTDKTLFTEHRALIGTPEYMSPEQADVSAVDIDTRSDIYALGVLLYELLTGVTPLEGSTLRSAAFAEMQRMIKEVEPPRPSVRVSTMTGAGASPPRPPGVAVPGQPKRTTADIAAARHTDPISLSRQLRGDLDWIVMKALEKDRTRRYESASAFAADVARHVTGDAVVAAPPSTAYRLRKFVRRNKVAVVGGSAVAAVLLLGIAGTSVGLLQARAATAREAERARAEALARDDAEWAAYAANLALAQAEMDGREWAKARQRLADCPESKRGWEWRLLSNKANAVRTEFRGRAKFSPDGTRVLGIDGQVVQLWDLDGNPKSPPIKHEDSVPTAVFSPDGRLVLATVDDNTARLWDLEGNPKSPPMKHEGRIHSAVFSPDGRMVLTASGDGTARLWDLEGNPKSPPMKHEDHVFTAVFSPDGQLVLTASEDRTARLWDLEGNPKSPPMKHEDSVRSAVFSADGRLVLTASAYGTARLWDLEGNPKGSPMKHQIHINSAVFSPNGRMVLTASADGITRMWDLEGNPKGPLMKHEGWVNSSVLSPNGRMVLTASTDGTARLWDLDGNPKSLPIKHDGVVYSAVFSPDELLVLTTSAEGTTRLWNLEGNPKGPPMNHQGGASSAVFSPDGRIVLTTSPSGTTRLWDLGNVVDTERPITDRALVQTEIEAELSPEADTLATSVGRPAPVTLSPEGRVTIAADAPPLLKQSTLARVESRFRALAISPDGSRLVTGEDNGAVRSWDVATGRELMMIRPLTIGLYQQVIAPAAVSDLRFSTTGDRIVVSRTDGTAVVLDARGPKEQAADIDRRHAERVPAGRYLDALWASPTPTDKLQDAILKDGSLTPLRRLVAAQVLAERQNDMQRAASAAFRELTRREITPERARAAVAESAQPLPPRVRDRFIELVNEWKPSANHLNNLAWDAVKRPGAAPERISAAIAATREAIKFSPSAAHVQNTLGVALYRAGEFAEAIEALERAVVLERGRLDVVDAAFLAMTKFRLDRRDEARADLATLRALMSSPDASKNEDNQAWLAEAVALIEGDGPGSPPASGQP